MQPCDPRLGREPLARGRAGSFQKLRLCAPYLYLRNPSAGTQETDTKKLLNHNSPAKSLGKGGLLLEKGNTHPLCHYTPVFQCPGIATSLCPSQHTHTHRPACKWNPSQGKHDTLKANPYLCSPSSPLESTCCLADLSLGICFLSGSCRTQWIKPVNYFDSICFFYSHLSPIPAPM